MEYNYVCRECGVRVNRIYIAYGYANIRLIKCLNCQNFVDKYVEYDPVTIFLDIILVKKQAYRHWILNGTTYSEFGLNSNLIKLGLLLNLFEVYMKWIIDDELLADGNVLLRYLQVLASCVAEFIVFHLVIRILCTMIIRFIPNKKLPTESGTLEIGFSKSAWTSKEANILMMSLIMSAFGKMLLIILVVWRHSLTNPTKIVNFFVFCCNYRAIDGL